MESLLISVLVVCILAGLVIWIIGQLPLPHPYGLIVRVVVAVLVLIYLLRLLLPAMRL